MASTFKCVVMKDQKIKSPPDVIIQNRKFVLAACFAFGFEFGHSVIFHFPSSCLSFISSPFMCPLSPQRGIHVALNFIVP